MRRATKRRCLPPSDPKIDGGIVLSGHTDVVPVAGQSWTSDPFTLRREVSAFMARGACDMKGFDAHLPRDDPGISGADLKRPIHILLSYDEETGLPRAARYDRAFRPGSAAPGAVIVGEPTRMQVADAHKSIATYRTTVHGHEAHSARSRSRRQRDRGRLRSDQRALPLRR